MEISSGKIGLLHVRSSIDGIKLHHRSLMVFCPPHAKSWGRFDGRPLPFPRDSSDFAGDLFGRRQNVEHGCTELLGDRDGIGGHLHSDIHLLPLHLHYLPHRPEYEGVQVAAIRDAIGRLQSDSGRFPTSVRHQTPVALALVLADP
jgi:hypothetical protein